MNKGSLAQWVDAVPKNPNLERGPRTKQVTKKLHIN
jgi:hypothetical protein